jgi:hypothetical protein
MIFMAPLSGRHGATGIPHPWARVLMQGQGATAIILAFFRNRYRPMDDINEHHDEENQPIQEPRVWQGQGWTARVIKNEDDEGWAVAMIKDGEPEPALVGPWTMGRDKKNPKPLDTKLHKNVRVSTDDGPVTVKLDIVPDEDDAYAILAAVDQYGEELASVRVRPDFKLTPGSASDWIESGFRKP